MHANLRVYLPTYLHTYILTYTRQRDLAAAHNFEDVHCHGTSVEAHLLSAFPAAPLFPLQVVRSYEGEAAALLPPLQPRNDPRRPG